MGKQLGFYFDQTLCTGCKACQVACKQWNQLPADGYELTLAVNHLSHFLLTELLLPRMREPARIVTAPDSKRPLRRAVRTCSIRALSPGPSRSLDAAISSKASKRAGS